MLRACHRTCPSPDREPLSASILGGTVEPAIQVTQKFWLNISEVSGLGWRLHPRTGLPDLLAVSDAEDTLLTAAFNGGGIQGAYNKVSNLPHGLRSERRAEWEAVAGDAAGRVLIVHETGSGLVVLAPDLSFERRGAVESDWGASGPHRGGAPLLLRPRPPRRGPQEK